MPRTVFPPTPGSSTDIKGADGTKQLETLQMTFLPEPALAGHDARHRQLTPTEDTVADRPATFTQPSETVKFRRRSSAAQRPKEQFALPPPPTRSRKIIQMKPRPKQDTSSTTTSNDTSAPKAEQSNAVTSGADAVPTASAGDKRKRPSNTTAAGRKMARKTAHSLIERRRRSKMNEEFALLKSMIPACSGEMHKLSILQASIEYIRYLEDCMGKLKARELERAPDSSARSLQYVETPFRRDHGCVDRNEDDDDDDDDDGSPDVEMEGSEIPSPALTTTHSRSQQPSVSPVLLAQDAQSRHHSHSSASTEYRHHGYITSASTSPAFGPQSYHYPQSMHSASGSALTSPALAPQRDMDREATDALLMLNQSDRRGTGRGMSVRDLLSH